MFSFRQRLSPSREFSAPLKRWKQWKKIAPVLEPRSQGRREPWERRCLWDQHHQWGRQNACVWHTWQGLGVLSWSSLNISVFWSFTKNLLKARWSSAESFLNKVIVTLVTQGPLPSCCVSWLFSTIDYRFISMYSVFYCACSTETCEKVYLCQGSHWAKSSVVFWRLTQNPDLALLTEMPTHVMPTMNAEHARFPVLHWPGPQNVGALDARRRTRERKNVWNTGSGRRCLGSRTYNLTACVVAYPGASNLPSHVNLRFWSFSLCLSRPSRLMPLTRNASAARNN